MAFVRVKGPDGAEFTIDEGVVGSMGVKVLDKPAVDVNGRPLPWKPATNLAGKPVTNHPTEAPASSKAKEA